ncbi:Uncharacterised protein [Mycolicibacterium vanbaalenii]|uniref:Uncharacterized protein n=1 Tax=Mycolicibacterium vanbaalenii TaxID=110539 RepID=A0A5S9RBP8_MYCVN|nr:hypothetical protein [Mycolicibacterium vanbaalenii]CAA0138204.1 Uncharacterised protein [Mycolicibacterium vanbaalenii]
MDSEFDGAGPMVVCPHGHANAWNYKFCGQCGLPIGAVAFPDDESEGNEVAGTGRPKRRGLLIGSAIATVVIVVAVAATAVVLLTRPSPDDSATATSSGFGTGGVDPASMIPQCTAAPAVQAESVDMTPDGLVVGAAFLSQCGGGSTEVGASVRITVADGNRDIAAGMFDFSAAPLTMKPGETARRTLVFPAGMYWRTPAMFSGAPQLVLHPEEQSTSTTVVAGPDRMVAQAVAEPEYGSIDGVADAVLGELRDADYEFVSGSIANRWVPQISSKKAGLTVDGRTLTSADVLRDHLELRAKYLGVRLVSSGQWTTFNSPDWWVTVIGVPGLHPAAANGWCDSQDLGVDDCFAKFVSSLFGVEGTTVYRK